MKGGIDLAGGEKGSDHAWLMDQTRPSMGRPLGTNRGTAFHSFPLSPPAGPQSVDRTSSSTKSSTANKSRTDTTRTHYWMNTHEHNDDLNWGLGHRYNYIGLVGCQELMREELRDGGPLLLSEPQHIRWTAVCVIQHSTSLADRCLHQIPEVIHILIS